MRFRRNCSGGGHCWDTRLDRLMDIQVCRRCPGRRLRGCCALFSARCPWDGGAAMTGYRQKAGRPVGRWRPASQEGLVSVRDILGCVLEPLECVSCPSLLESVPWAFWTPAVAAIPQNRPPVDGGRFGVSCFAICRLYRSSRSIFYWYNSARENYETRAPADAEIANGQSSDGFRLGALAAS